MAWKLSSTTFAAWYAAITCLDRGEIENWAIDGYRWLLMAIESLEHWDGSEGVRIPRAQDFLVLHGSTGFRCCLDPQPWRVGDAHFGLVDIPNCRLSSLCRFPQSSLCIPLLHVALHWSRSETHFPRWGWESGAGWEEFFQALWGNGASKWDGQVNIEDCTGALTQALKSLKAGVYLGFRARNWMFEFVRLLWFHVLCCWVCFGFPRFTWQLNACILFYSLAK